MLHFYEYNQPEHHNKQEVHIYVTEKMAARKTAYQIYPIGTMDDMDELLNEVKARNMYIIMDLVVNHCSDEHQWFQKACEDPEGEFGKYFYIETIKDDKLPNNWRSYFGGSV